MRKFLNRLFKKKPPEIDHKKQAIDDFKSFRDIGETFEYCGVKLMVVSHSELLPSYYGFDLIPRLTCDYKNTLGEIKVIKFSPFELQTLIKLNSKQGSN